jgi:tetratricopeptide (TPR) repeat protein
MTDHPDVVSTLHLALGTAYLRANLLDPAIGQFKLYLQGLPPDPPHDELVNKVAALDSVGRAIFTKGDDAGARPYLQQAVDLFRQIHGRDDIGDYPILGYLGLATSNLGDKPGGEQLLRQAVEICKATELPGEHKEWAVMEGLAQVLDAEGRHDEAKVLWDEAMKWETPKRTRPPRGSIVDAPPANTR